MIRSLSKSARRLCYLTGTFATVFLLLSSLSVSPLDDANSTELMEKITELKPYQPPDLNLQEILNPASEENDVDAPSAFDYSLGGAAGSVSVSCDLEPNDVLVLVHSAPDNFVRRKVIRETWGSRRVVGGLFWKLVFLIGQVGTYALQRELELESRKHQDMVQGNFTDHYRNLTQKHLMGYDWARKYCPGAERLLKTDDDVFADPYRVSALLTDTFKTTDLSRSIVCSVVSEGTLPIKTGSRKVTSREYPFDFYPQYCSGMAYLIGSTLSRHLLRLSNYVPRLWVDDVYVTGMLVSAIKSRSNVLPFNVRYTDEPRRVSSWLSSNVTKRFPYAFAEIKESTPFGVNGTLSWEATMRALWKKTKMVNPEKNDSEI